MIALLAFYIPGLMNDQRVELGFAEQTFIVLDKQLVVGEFKHEEAHEEGWLNFLPFSRNYYTICLVAEI